MPRLYYEQYPRKRFIILVRLTRPIHAKGRASQWLLSQKVEISESRATKGETLSRIDNHSISMRWDTPLCEAAINHGSSMHNENKEQRVLRDELCSSWRVRYVGQVRIFESLPSTMRPLVVALSNVRGRYKYSCETFQGPTFAILRDNKDARDGRSSKSPVDRFFNFFFYSRRLISFLTQLPINW